MKRLFKLAALTLVPFGFNTHALTIENCTLSYQGKISGFVADGYTHSVKAIAKLNAKKSDQNKIWYANSNKAKHGSITTTLDLDENFIENCDLLQGQVEFTPINSVDENKPWNQFQLHNESRSDKVITTSFDDGDYRIPLLIADGKTSGQKYSRPHVFELIEGDFSPVKTDITSGQGQLPAIKVGNRAMSIDGDGGKWVYRLSAASEDGRLVAGFAQLRESVTFEKRKKELTKKQTFAVIWQLKPSCDINKGKCNNQGASTISSVAGKLVSGKHVKRAANIKADSVKNFDWIVYDADATLSEVTAITTLADGSYVLSGRSASGHAALAKVTL